MKPRILLLFVLSIAIPSGSLFADVTLKTLTRSSGFKGIGANEGSTTRVVQGIKAREDSQFKFSGKMMKFMTGGDKSGTHIIRVDLDKMWQLDLKKKTYTEMTISQVMEKAKQKRAAHEPKSAGAPAAEEKPTHRVKKTDLTVKKTGAKKTINKFPTEETQARMLVEIEEIATKEVTTYTMLTNFWLTPLTADLKRAADEETAFQKAYLAKLGLTFSPQDRETYGGPGLGMLLGVGDKKTADLLTQLKEKTKDLSGYPIVIASEWRVQEDPKAVARRQEAQAKSAASDDETPDLTGDASAVAGNLMGAFAKKKMKQKQEAEAKKNEGKAELEAYFEVVGVKVAGVEADGFEVPKGFKKVER